MTSIRNEPKYWKNDNGTHFRFRCFSRKCFPFIGIVIHTSDYSKYSQFLGTSANYYFYTFMVTIILYIRRDNGGMSVVCDEGHFTPGGERAGW